MQSAYCSSCTAPLRAEHLRSNYTTPPAIDKLPAWPVLASSPPCLEWIPLIRVAHLGLGPFVSLSGSLPSSVLGRPPSFVSGWSGSASVGETLFYQDPSTKPDLATGGCCNDLMTNAGRGGGNIRGLSRCHCHEAITSTGPIYSLSRRHASCKCHQVGPGFAPCSATPSACVYLLPPQFLHILVCC